MAESFRELMKRVRAGDAGAAAEVVRLYETEIRRSIRVRLVDSRLRRTLDSLDICQSVLANFFLRATAGQFDLDEPQQLLRLLLKMARNKLIDKARLEQVRGGDRQQGDAGGASPLLNKVADPAESPSQLAVGKELLEAAYRLLTPEERAVAQQRAQGRSWQEIAAGTGRSPEAVRKQLERSLDRVVEQLGLAPPGAK